MIQLDFLKKIMFRGVWVKSAQSEGKKTCSTKNPFSCQFFVLETNQLKLAKNIPFLLSPKIGISEEIFHNPHPPPPNPSPSSSPEAYLFLKCSLPLTFEFFHQFIPPVADCQILLFWGRFFQTILNPFDTGWYNSNDLIKKINGTYMSKPSYPSTKPWKVLGT